MDLSLFSILKIALVVWLAVWVYHKLNTPSPPTGTPVAP